MYICNTLFNRGLTMINIQIQTLKVQDKCLFQLSHWSPVNLHKVIILYVGSRYIVMYNVDREEEYCVSIDKYDDMSGYTNSVNSQPKFYVDENNLF